jgi:lysine biosynthesis protein LysW
MNAKDERKEVITACPECRQRIALHSVPKLGQRLVCTRCGTELKVIETEPLKLAQAFTV